MNRKEIETLIETIERFAGEINTDAPGKFDARYGRTMMGVMIALDSLIPGNSTKEYLDTAIEWLQLAKEVA